jgi:hypothetical protein
MNNNNNNTQIDAPQSKQMKKKCGSMLKSHFSHSPVTLKQMQNNTEETINEGSDLVIIVNLHLVLSDVSLDDISPFHVVSCLLCIDDCGHF